MFDHLGLSKKHINYNTKFVFLRKKNPAPKKNISCGIEETCLYSKEVKSVQQGAVVSGHACINVYKCIFIASYQYSSDTDAVLDHIWCWNQTYSYPNANGRLESLWYCLDEFGSAIRRVIPFERGLTLEKVFKRRYTQIVLKKGTDF